MSDSMRPSASDPVPDDVRAYPNARACEHGHRRGKCDLCDVLAEMDALRARVEAVEAALYAHGPVEPV